MKTFILINGKEVRIIKSQTIETATIIAENLLDHSKEIIVREIEANAKLIASAPELLGALILANKELKSIISILDGRISPEIAKTDLGMRLISFFKANAFICEDKIDPIINKAIK